MSNKERVRVHYMESTYVIGYSGKGMERRDKPNCGLLQCLTSR